ncbi:hypothetical protein OC845_005208 [Tilletia horrida]|nr:hypothetical protein OC845_005208 [Tilletia horrida]
MATYALDDKDAFSLALRFSKCSIIVPVKPTTTLAELKQDIIAAIQALTLSGRILHAGNGWEQTGGRDPADELEPQHIGIFRAGVSASTAAQEEKLGAGNVAPGWEPPTSFHRIDNEKSTSSASSGSRITVASLAFRQGSDQVGYLGFAPKGSNTVARPVFATPAFLDEDEEGDGEAGLAENGEGEEDNGEQEEGEPDEDDDAWMRAGVTLGGGGS